MKIEFGSYAEAQEFKRWFDECVTCECPEIIHHNKVAVSYSHSHYCRYEQLREAIDMALLIPVSGVGSTSNSDNQTQTMNNPAS